ncbi:hypothetical protein Smic_67640 [Streptomyces microflavus]|uniref:Winged helix DNA-binding domain-containing protein n=1 Tax=Streptomyces microflavus TaxID=1919 RepID=A0A7J0D0J7_STRMI|nr:hypothetical protein Smic_67640 [Streptomyces microflavus]
MAAKTPRTAAHPAVLTTRALNRATLDRQLLLRRSAMSAKDAVAHLVGLQAQNTRPPYFQLYSRLAEFDPGELSRLMESREVVRIVTLRSTLHTHTADDALTLRPLVQAARDRELKAFRHGLAGVDLDRLAAVSRELVEERPARSKSCVRSCSAGGPRPTRSPSRWPPGACCHWSRSPRAGCGSAAGRSP